MLKSIGVFLLVLMVTLAFPESVASQPMTSGFHGTVSAAGAALPDGTEVSAWIDDVKVAQTETSDSSYSIFVSGSYTEKTVVFKVGKYVAEQTGSWVRGETAVLDLSINTWPYACDFYGLVTVDGVRVDDGTEVSAWIDSARVQTTTTIDSLYRIAVPGNYTGKMVIFKVGNDFATQIAAWERGAELETNLTISLGPLVCGFYGAVQLDGDVVADGTQITAWIDDVKVQTTTTLDSKYGLNIPGNYSGKLVLFEVNDQRATETTLWSRGSNKPVDLTAITTETPVVTLTLSDAKVRPGQEFSVIVAVDPKGHGISGGAIDFLSLDTSIMETVLDAVTPGTLLGADAIEGIKEKTVSEEGLETFRYAQARKGTTPVPTAADALVTVGFRIRGGAAAGKYAIPNAMSLTDEAFRDLSFVPPTVSITVIAAVPGDMDGDDRVGLTDLAIMASAYGSEDGVEGYRNEADLNGDKEIGLPDLAILAGHWSG